LPVTLRCWQGAIAANVGGVSASLRLSGRAAPPVLPLAGDLVSWPPTVKVDDVIKYADLVSAEGANLQKGMNSRRRLDGEWKIFSRRKRFQERLEQETGTRESL
jgi:hypothetical protein